MLGRRLTASLSLLVGLLPSAELCDAERVIRKALLGVLEKENALVTCSFKSDHRISIGKFNVAGKNVYALKNDLHTIHGKITISWA